MEETALHNQSHHIARRGFTLLEMLIVIFIILMLAGIVAYNLVGTQERAEEDAVRVQINVLENALQSFRVDMERWPTDEEGIAVLWSKEGLSEDANSSRWRKLVNDPVPKDRFGHEWVYNQPSLLREGEPYDIISVGRDGEEGTDDDITNHSLRSGADESDDGAPTGLTPITTGR
jgi:general secretion pathway protein G